MSAEDWEPWLSELEAASAACDDARLAAALDDLWRFPFHEQRARRHDCWDRLFVVLVRGLGSEVARVRDLCDHYARIVMGAEYGPPYDDTIQEQRSAYVERRTAQLLPALTPLVRSGEKSLLRTIDDQVHVEDLADCAPQRVVEEFIAAVAAGSPLELAARIAYLDGRAAWERPGESLVGCLDHADDMVRAYAARALGKRYCDAREVLSPPLPEFASRLTAKEIERPGIAGPFFSNWYGFGMQDFADRAEVQVEDWLCTILAQRKHPEPDTLPCSNGIDFFAHEIFGGRPGYVRRLLDMGHRELAVEAATEIDYEVDDMEPILVELGNSAEAEICRRACWHLAYHYRRLHTEGEARGFVARRTLARGVDLFINFVQPPEGQRYAYAATIFAPHGEAFDKATAAALLDTVLPPSLRGDLVPFGAPGDGGVPGLYSFDGQSANARYACGALALFRGDAGAQRWTSIRIIWHGTPGAWRPEDCG
ncbi:hypothetical protein [Mycobacterium bourgelatii]|uniref:Uncharacterized protein n=1 Tax=Mycobacterium bourgelatii TaxID=1273442 RepID=A0A7I9YKL8_MYCBU|nr:hypothetical protein [Mycobacterium bourgelatii]MCV6974586.1 hypothetical protein [Mycobacterium bourgelatii]GFG89053.1 hypothetical protein MBOU_10950 [Mycobacterium bourgelatii]